MLSSNFTALLAERHSKSAKGAVGTARQKSATRNGASILRNGAESSTVDDAGTDDAAPRSDGEGAPLMHEKEQPKWISPTLKRKMQLAKERKAKGELKQRRAIASKLV